MKQARGAKGAKTKSTAIAERAGGAVAKGPERTEAQLEETNDVEEVRAITAASKAAVKYVEQRKEGVREINRWLRVVLKGQRKLGAFLLEAAPHGGDRRSSRASGSHLKLKTLGVAPFESRRCRELARIDEDVFDSHLKKTCEKGERLTTSGMIAATSDAPDYDSDEWFTPVDTIELVRTVLGEIELDPASCLKAQENVVAQRFYTEEHSGLKRDWQGKVFLNPPYSDPAPWIAKLLEAHREGDVEAAIVLVNNTTDTEWAQDLLAHAARICFTKGRIAFLRDDGAPVTGARQGQMFCYLGPDLRAFEDVFADVGVIVVPQEAAIAGTAEDEPEEKPAAGDWFDEEQPEASA